ncbi:BRO-N domain-containing protein [Aeromonas rivipollensis]|uniref:BRO-N domain-containing protein n=1 Tax=Aeromonas rivipollensis TaxID=948519 RepID=UPI0038D133B7
MKITKHTFTVSNDLSFDVRIVLRDGEPWLVAKDVADALGYSSAKDMTRMLDEDEKGAHILPTLGGNQEMTIINESGLYSAIIGSRKPEVKMFKRWVTKTVLPSIRKHGAYLMGQEALPEALQADLAAAAREDLRVMKNRIMITCGAREYSKDDQAKIAVAYRAAVAIGQAKGLPDFPYDSFSEQLVLLQVPHLKGPERRAQMKFNEAFCIGEYQRDLLKKHNAAYSSFA